MTDKELMQQALNALEGLLGDEEDGGVADWRLRIAGHVVNADLRSRLEQPEDEPAAYRVYFPDDQRQEYCDELDDLCEDLTNCRHEITPLYAAAPVSAACNWPSCKSEEYQKALAIDVGDAIIGKAPHDREWVGLTDGEIRRIIGPWGGTPVKGYTRTLFDQIEAKLKEKNTL